MLNRPSAWFTLESEGKFSDKPQDQNAVTLVEANHRFQLTLWLYATPDF